MSYAGLPATKLWSQLLRFHQVHEANMGPIWGRQDPGGPHVGLVNFAIWDSLSDGTDK